AGLRARGRRGACPRRHDRRRCDPPRRRRRRLRHLPAAELLRLPRARPGAGGGGARGRRAAGRTRRPHLARRSRGARPGRAPARDGGGLGVGEGQGCGNALSCGGPHYGFLAARAEYTRRMPGRIVGETTDAAGNRGYVLTLQTREQHIRREKATHNITTNQTLLALGGLITLSWLGPQGLREVRAA